jgi:glycosidase
MAREDRNSPYRDYYVWTDDPKKYNDARIIFIDTEESNWVRHDTTHTTTRHDTHHDTTSSVKE